MGLHHTSLVCFGSLWALVIARDEKWVPSTERVKISPTNVRLETTVHQKEETFQVIIDVIKNSTCFKAFTISAEVPEIFMQQFWYTIKKIIDICPRVEGDEFTELQDDDATLTFIIDLGYKGPLHKYTSMKNVDYPELIWEDFAFQIDHKKEKKSRRETMPFPRFTKVIINHFLLQHKSLSKLKFQHYHTIKDDGIIKKSESYQMFLKYSTSLIPPKKSRGKGSQGKKTIDVSQESVNVSDESEPKPAKKKTGSRTVSCTLARRKILDICPRVEGEYFTKVQDDDDTLTFIIDLGYKDQGKSESYQLFLKYSTSLITPKKSRGIKGLKGKIGTIDVSQESVNVSDESEPEPAKKKTAALKLKLKGVKSLTPKEQEVVDTMQALKESNKTNIRQPGTGGSSKGTGKVPGVPDESIVVSATSSEGTSTKPGVPDKENVTLEENVILEWGSEHESEHSEDSQLMSDEKEKKGNDGDANDEDEDDDHIKEKGDAKLAEKAMTSDYQVKESTEFPMPSSSLSVSSGYGTYFLNLSSDIYLTGVLKDSTKA
ncbi:hypothetical protein Tco_0582772 [Tanacetum coccineum]